MINKLFVIDSYIKRWYGSERKQFYTDAHNRSFFSDLQVTATGCAANTYHRTFDDDLIQI